MSDEEPEEEFISTLIDLGRILLPLPDITGAKIIDKVYWDWRRFRFSTDHILLIYCLRRVHISNSDRYEQVSYPTAKERDAAYRQLSRAAREYDHVLRATERLTGQKQAQYFGDGGAFQAPGPSTIQRQGFIGPSGHTGSSGIQGVSGFTGYAPSGPLTARGAMMMQQEQDRQQQQLGLLAQLNADEMMKHLGIDMVEAKGNRHSIFHGFQKLLGGVFPEDH